MILLCGIPSEAPMQLVIDACESVGLPVRVINQRRFSSVPVEFWIGEGEVQGTAGLDGEAISLDEVTGIYVRLMDDRFLPEVRELPEQDPVRRACRTWHEVLFTFAELTPARVANRASAMASNASKPFQAQIALEAGFQVPETLVTNDPELVLEFCSRHPRVIYKSTSGVRSIVQELTPEDLPRLGRIRWCPTQFQELVEGQDVRVHTVGSNAIATAVRSRSVDYRYAGRDGGPAAQLEAVSLPDEAAERCVALAAALNLPFAGIDLRMAHDGRVICFEVNPSPAFSYYERHTGQPIARELALWLAES